jgi:hypothetical protein
MTCKELLRQCGDGPYESRNQNNVLSSVGGGIISQQCAGIVMGRSPATRIAMGNFHMMERRQSSYTLLIPLDVDRDSGMISPTVPI